MERGGGGVVCPEMTASAAASAFRSPETSAPSADAHHSSKGELGTFQTIKARSWSGFQAKVLNIVEGVPCSLGSGEGVVKKKGGSCAPR